MTEPQTVQQRVEEVRAYLSGADGPPNHWSLVEWVNAATIHLGQAARWSNPGSVAGTDISDARQVVEHLLMLAAISIDAIESIERK